MYKLHDLIKKIEKRPAIYLEMYSITALQHFINGYSYNEDEEILNLFVSIFSPNLNDKSLTQTEINQAFNDNFDMIHLEKAAC